VRKKKVKKPSEVAKGKKYTSEGKKVGELSEGFKRENHALPLKEVSLSLEDVLKKAKKNT